MAKALNQEEVIRRITKNFKQKVILIGKYINRRIAVELLCEDCDYKWLARPATFLYSSSCECPNCGEHALNRIEFSCEVCGKIIYRTPSEIKKNTTGKFYCSRICGNKDKANLIHSLGSKNYRLKAMKIYPHECASCKWNEDERILEVHHIDENRENNDISNLIILCPTCHRKITLGYYTLVNNSRLIRKD